MTDEEMAAVREALLTWRAEGVADPRIPLNVDVDGDGIADAFALDDNDQVVIVPATPVADTVYTADGSEGF